jgi:hypothetical protein
MIPKHIFSCWLSQNPDMPSLVRECIDSHVIPGYTYHLITLENCSKKSQYVRQALEHRRWVKAADFLRVQYMYENGGIYLDADMKILPDKNFDDLLDNKMFVSVDVYNLWANAGFGAEAGHPILKAYMDRVEMNYKGDGDLIFEPGIRTFHDICWVADKDSFTTVETEVFHPYHHGTGKVNITPKTKVYHYYMKSWQK